MVVLPHASATLFVGRPKSLAAVDEALRSAEKKILLVLQRSSDVEEPGPDDLYKVGTIGHITQTVSLADGSIKILADGLERARVQSYNDEGPFLVANASTFHPTMVDEETLYVLDRILISEFEQYAKFNKKATLDFLNDFLKNSNYEKIIDAMSVQLMLTLPERQELLEAEFIKDRMELLLGFIRREIESLQTEDKIRQRIKSQMNKNHREYYLQEQLKAIQKELHSEDGKDELTVLEDKVKAAGLSKEASAKARAEIKKLRHISPLSAEAVVIRNYLEWLLEIPWKRVALKPIKLDEASEQLERDHYGLEKVKERILEFLAVQQRVGKIKGQILCFVGAPGVGKTSLARSIAQALNRPFVRMALGGMRDEAEIRGHRRTYVGALPGKIIQNMKKAKATNPLFLLDEIDKMGADWRGDPASALLEVLDPEQNKAFNDHYLEVDYDLSNVVFVATANSLDFPKPLLDRLEVIRIEGYTEQEKLNIALQYLMPKKKAEVGLLDTELEISAPALLEIIRSYTREAGVRNLEREIAKICRKVVTQLEQKKASNIKIMPENLSVFLGVPRYKFGCPDMEPQVGATTGLAWTEAGGDLLTIEAVKSRGKGKITITGKLGEVMRESVQAAFSYVKSRASFFGIPAQKLSQVDIHVHVPEGATPKDGPSAGIAIATSLISSLTGIPVSPSVAMTGEITLRGHVLGIGGLKEKLLAALRGGIKTVLIPKDNMKDLVDVPQVVKDSLKIVGVSRLEEVLSLALLTPLVPLDEGEEVFHLEPSSPLGSSKFSSSLPLSPGNRQ